MTQHPPLFREVGPVATATTTVHPALDATEVRRRHLEQEIAQAARGRRVVLLRIAGEGGPELAREVARRLALHRRVHAVPADEPMDGAYAFIDGRLDGNRVRFTVEVGEKRSKDSVSGDRLQLEGRLMRKVAQLGRRK